MKRLAALAVLALGWTGCAMLEESTLQQRAEPPLVEWPEEEVQGHANEATSPVSAAPQGDQALPTQPPDEVDVEIRTPLKDVLLAAPASSASEASRKRYAVQRGDTLASIADRHGVTLPMLQAANRLDSDRIRSGQRMTIPALALRIEIDKSENRLRLFNGPELVRTYPVATGDQGVTPTGSYTIANRLIGPTWYWQGYAVPPDDPEYPLGSRWLGLSRRGYGIHGTNEPDSIGKQVSHGCIRMHNADVEELFDVVSVGTPVTILE